VEKEMLYPTQDLVELVSHMMVELQHIQAVMVDPV
jgi:hypothetical protein